jgi:hypothetical protein
MRPRERRESGKQDLFRSRLDQIIDMNHALVKLARAIDWRFLEERFGAVYSDTPGQPPLPTRLMTGLAILKHSYDLSDQALCDRWVENPYFQYFCGEEFFQHVLVFDRSSLTRWRQRMGEEKLQALLQESLAVATRTDAMKPSDLARVVIDTTVQPKAVMFPTDAKLLNRARERLVRLTKKLGVSLRQSYARVGKLALIKHQRYASAPTVAYASSRPISAVSSATSSGESSGMKVCGKHSYGRCSWPGACWNRSAASAAARSIPCTRQRSSASARARRTGPTSSASR